MDSKLPIDIFENVMQLAIEGCKAVANYIPEVSAFFFFVVIDNAGIHTVCDLVRIYWVTFVIDQYSMTSPIKKKKKNKMLTDIYIEILASFVLLSVIMDLLEFFIGFAGR